MKVAIYTIALNEEQFVKRWYESAKDADYLLIADTGSTDNTARVAQRLGINVVSINIKPWRFEDARNAALAMLPPDIDMCISLDMDEVITPNWREPLEKAWKAGVTRPRYKHVWSWNNDGSPGLEFAYDHIHSRHGYRWKHPVHETLVPYSIEEVSSFVAGIETHHHPDKSKSRSQYLNLLKLSVEEDPNSDRNAHYYARELYFNGKYSEAIKEFKRHLSLPSAKWKAERSASMRYLAKCDRSNAESWYKKAAEEDPTRREPLVELAMIFYSTSNWEECHRYSVKALSIKEKPLDYLCEDFAWGALPNDLAALSAYYLKKYKEAVAYGSSALSLDKSNERLLNNLKMYSLAIQS